VRRGIVLGGNAGALGDQSDDTVELPATVEFKRRGVETRLVLPGLAEQNHGSRCDPALIKALARGHAWFGELATGRVRSMGVLNRIIRARPICSSCAIRMGWSAMSASFRKAEASASAS